MVTLKESISIRPMQIDDLDEVMGIEESVFASPWSARNYRFELSENPASRQWVAEAKRNGETRIIGMTVVWLLVDEAYIANIAIIPEFRGRGIAKQLLCTALTALAADGAVSAGLEVRAGNASAQSLYRSFGFRKVGRRRAYYRDNGEDAILMSLPDITKIETDCKKIQEHTLWRTS
jgi:ribosomal-protein-alanine N-acetyltransferase